MIQGGDFRGSGKQAMRLRRATFAALMMTSCPATMCMAAPAYAQQVTRDFDIAAQPLADALTAFGQQSGLQVSAQAPLVEGRTSSAVRGALPPLQALSQLLTGTGLSFRVIGSTVTLERAPQSADSAVQLGPVRVEGASGNNGSGLNYSAGDLITEGTKSYTTRATTAATRLPLSLRDTPQSVSIITRQRIEDQRLDTVGDVLLNTTGIQVFGSDSERDEWYSRGFYIGKVLIDGMPNDISSGGSFGDATSSTAIYDRVEVVRGATGLLSGSGDPSASVQLIRKRATSRDLAVVAQLSAGSWNNYQGMIDLSAPLVSSGDVRMRGVMDHQDTESVADRYHSRRNAFLLTVEADLSPATVLVIGADYRDSRTNGSTYGSLPPIYTDNRPTNFGPSASIAPDWAFWNSNSWSAFTTLEHVFANGWRAKGGVTFRRNDYDAKGIYIYGVDATSFEGMYTRLGKFGSQNEAWSYEVDLSGPLTLLGRTHEFVFGLSGTRVSGDNYEQIIYPGEADTPGNVLDWLDGSYPEPDWSTTPFDGVTAQYGYYGAARLSLADPLRLIVGARYSTWNSRGSYGGVVNPRRSFDAFTPYAGAIFDVSKSLSIYASYTRIFNPQDYKDKFGERLDPITGENYEAGLKASWLDGRLNGSISLFRTLQDNVGQVDGANLVPGTFDPAYIGLKGVTTQGGEAELSGELMPGWQVTIGGSIFKSKDSDGNEVQKWLPRKTFRMFTSYRLPGRLRDLTIGGGVNWQGSSEELIWTGTDEVAVVSPKYAIINLMARYALTDALSLQANLNNGFDKRYFQGTGSYGTPRNVLVTLRGKF